MFRFSGKKRKDLPAGDDELIRSYRRNGNADVVGILFERYTHLVFGVCMKYLKNREDAEDALMGIFEKLLADLKTHRVHDFKNWLYRVSKNHCLMILRKENLTQHVLNETRIIIRQEFMENAEEWHPVLGNDPDISILLHRAMEALKPEQRKCLEMMYYEKKSYKEIVVLTGYSLKQVKSHIQNGKRNLKNMMTAP
jgi:RNA polymerase sigma-70 factor (ECF subfamily)